MFKLIHRGHVFADCQGWPVIVASSDAQVVRYWRQGRIHTASIARFHNAFEPISHEEAQQIKADLEQ
ncbi:DUF4222 domain-containing protein, partial [Klebsiella pneumoniae]|nr:DUF4222 domain-containing protein [Klebsiella pneumoniae]